MGDFRRKSTVAQQGEILQVKFRKVLNTNDNKISLSIKAVDDFKEVDEIEEKQAEEYSSNESVGTSLGDLLKGLKL